MPVSVKTELLLWATRPTAQFVFSGTGFPSKTRYQKFKSGENRPNTSVLGSVFRVGGGEGTNKRISGVALEGRKRSDAGSAARISTRESRGEKTAGGQRQSATLCFEKM